VNGDGCSSTCAIETFWACDGTVGARSTCNKTLGWVQIRTFDLNNVNPEAIHYVPKTRSFVGLKTNEAAAPLELCIDGTVINHPPPSGGNGQICEPGVPLGSASCSSFPQTDEIARYYPFDANGMTGATYDPGSGSWYFLDSSGLTRMCSLPHYSQGLQTNFSRVALTGKGIAIGDDGRLYVAVDDGGHIRVYNRKANVTGCDIGFDIAGGPVASWTHTTKAAFDGIFSLSGMGMLGTYVGAASATTHYFRFLDLSGNVIASPNMSDTSIIKTLSGGTVANDQTLARPRQSPYSQRTPAASVIRRGNLREMLSCLSAIPSSDEFTGPRCSTPTDSPASH
jgi:hypothetical protein